jgi:acyl dehydratase
MAINRGYLGRSFPAADPYEVSRVKIRDFADAIGDPNPVFRDRAAAQAAGHPDVIAPPTFAIVVAAAAGAKAIADPGLGVNYAMIVHGEQRFVYTRPVRAGDRLVTTIVVETIRSAAGNDMITTRADVATEDGEPVVSAYSTLVARGTAEAETAAS